MRQTLGDIADVKNDPLIFIAKQLFSFLGAWIIIILIFEIVVLVLLGIAGFSSWFGRPLGIARFFFWVFMVGFTGEIIVLVWLQHRIVSFLKTHQSRFKAAIVDVSVK